MNKLVLFDIDGTLITDALFWSTIVYIDAN